MKNGTPLDREICLMGFWYIMEVRIKTAVKDYTVHIDSKKRITLRGALFQYCNVKEYDNGCIVLEPRELTVNIRK